MGVYKVGFGVGFSLLPLTLPVPDARIMRARARVRVLTREEFSQVPAFDCFALPPPVAGRFFSL